MCDGIIIGHDITYQNDIDQGNEIADIRVEQNGKSVTIDAYHNGEQWAPWYAELNRSMKLDCGNEDAARVLLNQLTAGGQSTIDALAKIYEKPISWVTTWFQPKEVG